MNKKQDFEEFKRFFKKYGVPYRILNWNRDGRKKVGVAMWFVFDDETGEFIGVESDETSEFIPRKKK